MRKTLLDLAAAVHPLSQGLSGDSGSSPARTAPDLGALVAAGEKFGTIYADPPWLYDNQACQGAHGKHYNGMTVEELCELPVRQLTAKNAHLHLWVTGAFEDEAPRIMQAWGFEKTSTGLVWVKKPGLGLGNCWRSDVERCLLGVRGQARSFADKSLSNVVIGSGGWDIVVCPRSRHSAKPEQVRRMIERASPAPRLELFGRRPVQGWTVMGNQIDGSGLPFFATEEVA